MEFTSDVLSIAGILVNAKAKFGDLHSIIYKGLGGTEEKISYILESFRTFLKSKSYIEDELPNPEFKNYFEELLLFLIVNTQFSKSFSIEEYSHITYNVPKISKYLLARITLNLNMTEYFCSASLKIPIIYSCELYSEFIPCLDKLKLVPLLQNTYLILNNIATIIMENQDSKNSDEMDTLLGTVPEFFFRFSRISAEQLPKLKKDTLYKQAGFVLKSLFNLLLFCHKNNLLYGIFIDRLIEATINVVRGVPLDMFCYWAEIDIDGGQTLQNEIAENAYVIIEKYQQLKPASEMVQSLKPFASKPRSIKEQINTADIDKIVFMVNKADENQKQWFESLIFSPFFSSEKAIECVSKWSHLCNEEDVSRLLKLSLKVNQDEAKMLSVKCASLLNLRQLIVVVTRHFYNNGFVILNNDTQQEITVLFNKLKDCEAIKENITKELLLLILQNPDLSISFILTECIRSAFYVSILRDSFSTLKDVLMANDICLNCLQKAMRTSPPNTGNFDSYVNFLQMLLDIGLLTTESLIIRIINPYIQECIRSDNMEELKNIVKFLNILNISVQVKDSLEPFFGNLIEVLRLRTKFMDHKSSRQAVVQEAVNLMNNKVHRNEYKDLPILAENSDDDVFISYYKNRVSCAEKNVTLLQHLFHDYSVENRTKAVCHLVQILPSCVTDEWLSICSEIAQKSSCKDLLETINDMMFLLCEFTETQEKTENYTTLLEALKYCIRQLGIVIQNNILSSSCYVEDEIIVTEALVKLLCHLPPTLKENEGLNILSIMTERSLKNLGKDKKFVTRICQIKNTKICQVLAQKILG